MHILTDLKIMRNRIIVWIIVAGIFVCAGLNIYQFLRYGFYKSIDISEEVRFGEADYSWNIDLWEKKNDIYQISGWIIRRNEDISTRNIHLVIENEDGTTYLIPTSMVKRIDITNGLNGENESFDYDYSGFITSVNRMYVHSEECKLYVLYGNNGRHELVDLGRTFDIE